jgi:hypothetical protein
MTTINEIEFQQLGTKKDNGFNYIPDLNSWLEFRKFLVAKSKKRNPDYFDENLAAYTPGETLQLLNKKEIVDWFKMLNNFQIPEGYDAFVLVPCAASKPWFNHKNVNKSKLYKSYNQIINDVDSNKFKKIYFLTISEPLGIVPQELWNHFPKYDNPGLFKDDFLRTGLVKTDWDKTFLGSKHILPFDDIAYEQCINKLAFVIEKFLSKITVPIISFVDAKEHTTHGHMLDVVHELNPNIKISRHMKKFEARTEPYDYIKNTIFSELSISSKLKV